VDIGAPYGVSKQAVSDLLRRRNHPPLSKRNRKTRRFYLAQRALTNVG